MPPTPQQTSPVSPSPDDRDLNERYMTGLQNLAVSSQQAKINKISAWSNNDKLVNDFFVFSLLTLGVMATLLTAREDVIGNRALFYISLFLLSFVVVLSSILRLYINSVTAETSSKVFDEFINRINKIDIFRLAMTNTDKGEKDKVNERMLASFAPEYEFIPKDNSWMIKHGQKVVVSTFVIAFLLFILSLVLKVTINV